MMTVLEFTLNDQDRARLNSSLLDLPDPYCDFAAFDSELLSMRSLLPNELVIALDKLRYGNSSYVGILIRNLPIDADLPPTPPLGTAANTKSTFVSEGASAMLAKELGFIFGYEQERTGAIIQNIVPEEEHVNLNSSEGSKAALQYHIDNGYLDCRPDFVNLFCVRSDPNQETKTIIIDAQAIVSALSKEVLKQLSKPEYQIRFSYSFVKRDSDLEWSDPKPILSGPRSNLELCVKFGVTRGTTPGAKNALELLQQACAHATNTTALSLQQGDALVLSNRRAIHSRSPFKAKFDGTDRWLQRIYVTCNPWPWRNMFNRDGRIVTALAD